MSAKTSKFHQALTLNYTNDLYGIALKKGDCIFLTGSCPVPTSPAIYNGLLDSFRNDNKFCSYNTGMQILKREIALYIKDHSHIDINPNTNLLITLGATTFLQQLFLFLLDEDKECLVITPTFQDYFNQIRLTRCPIVQVPMLEEKDRWVLDTSAVRAAMTNKTRIILLCNPNNPTGKIYSKEEIAELGRIAKEYNAYLVADEAYNYLTYGKPFTSILDIPDICTNVICVRTFSKEFSMCGWRVGYTYVPEDLYEELFHFQLSANTAAPAISQKAATIALQSPDIKKWVAEEVRITKEKRDSVMRMVREIGADLSFIVPEACPYLFVKYGKKIESYDLCKDIILKSSVIVSPGIGNGTGGEDHFCITFADGCEVLEEGLRRLKEYFQKHY